VSKWVSTIGSRSYRYEILSANTIRMLIENGSTLSNATSTTAIPSYAAGSWFYLVVTYDASAGEVRHYVNGSQLGTTRTGINTAINNSAATFSIGRPDSTSSGDYFDGIIDEVGIWSKVLTTTEISDLYNSGSGIPYEAAASGIVNLKTYNTITKANTKTLNGIAIANVKTLNTIT